MVRPLIFERACKLKNEVTFLARAPNDELDSLLVDSVLAAIERRLTQIEAALRSLAELLAKVDPLRLVIVREAAIRELCEARITTPAAVVDTALNGRKPLAQSNAVLGPTIQ